MKTLALLLIVTGLNAAAVAAVDFSRDIRPLLNKQCTTCHGGVKRAGGVSFLGRDLAMTPAKSGAIPVRPGNPGESELIRWITEQDEDERMPPADHGPALTAREVALLREWIQQGAPWDVHWAYQPPQAQPLPKVRNRRWPQQSLDHFILARLEAEKLEPSRAADRVDWLRRASLDLTGLPPTLEDVRLFLADRSADAFETVADRLLASPHFGERWAAMWLDLARYADSKGYESDDARTMWPYRDWLIRAFNADLPFDQFTLRQLAGDLLPDATIEDILATAFHRNTPTNDEGGTDDEEFRVVATLDRVATTWKTWQAVSFNCVQCHAHPYEPIEHAEFYRFLAFFNTSQDWDITSDIPHLDVPLDGADFSRARQLELRARVLRQQEHADTGRLDADAAPAQWRPLVPLSAASSHLTRLVIKPAAEGGADVLTEGTVSHDSQFTIDLPRPPDLEKWTALRVEARPLQPDKARYTPELGFVISRLRAQLITATNEAEIAAHAQSLADARRALTEVTQKGAEAVEAEKKLRQEKMDALNGEAWPGEIKLAVALGDEVTPFDDAQSTLHQDKQGWGALPRLTGLRRLIVVPEQPAALPPNARLRLVILQEAAPNGYWPLVMNRSRYSLTDHPAWTALAGDGAFRARRDELAALTADRKKIASAAVPVMREQDRHLRRATAVFTRGDWLNKGGEVTAAVPRLFPQLPADAPADRLAMALWLVSKDNPLTARVAVNRFWEQLFGAGLVETVEDFASTGRPPSHPELLDHLALRFQNELGWSMKRLLRELILSSTYRQSANATQELRQRDPRNRLLARGPRTRLSAEMVRDSALAVSGLLATKLFGPPVKPLQPDGIWRAARSGMNKWETSQGDDAHRRALYTYWRRSSPYPSLVTFDAPSRIVCSPQRISTSTPLQALVTLNDPAFVECAVGLARRMADEGGPEIPSQITRGYELATGRPPAPADLADLLALHRKALDEYCRDPELAEPLGGCPETAALALVGNAILNLDVVLTK
ncbi:MAG: PSD1 and planctomycete cytochrome C domain-containing protein [Verrucomicrobiales bacterium]|nr:PSD1 and planctomycete cytochrome C domain-containing protein [Verrucomicrobiales bacterium]